MVGITTLLERVETLAQGKCNELFGMVLVEIIVKINKLTKEVLPNLEPSLDKQMHISRLKSTATSKLGTIFRLRKAKI